MEILKLKPVGKEYLWGGTKLKEEFSKNIDIMPLAETWECSVHNEGLSTVAEGKFKNKTLKEVLEKYPKYLGVNLQDKKELPILVKLIDAKEDLSVQVHPDDFFAMQNENQNGKSEMLYVIDASENSNLILGYTKPVDASILENAIKNNDLDKYLRKIPVKKGDCFYIPAGTIHAISSGSLVLEIAQNSNLTYRVYDYDRVDKTGNKRELNFDKAIKVMNMEEYLGYKKEPKKVYYDEFSIEKICDCEYFEVDKIDVFDSFSFIVDDKSFQVIVCVDGEGQIEYKKGVISLKKGDTVFIPANAKKCKINGKMTLLKVKC
ncbi:MAG: class I mannose-6-phosphate isomerase [Clostridiales bacterium]|nr:class I mannose-6-phosphate isomerase [Clostridiales bacterium]